MAAITASMVKELREKTGAGMMDCKKALVEAEGNMEVAVDELRKRGQAIADKKGARATKEGLIFAKIDGTVSAMIELACETDFVARNEEFKAMGVEMVDMVLAGGEAVLAGDVEKFNGLSMAGFEGKTVNEVIREAVAKIGENMSVSRFVRLESQGEGAGFIQAYIHPPGKLGVLVELKAGKAETLAQDGFKTLASDLAMHIAAAAPVCLTKDGVPADLVARERAIFADQVKMEGKPEKIWDRIIDGKLSKFFKDICLLDQIFVKDSDLTISALLAKVGKELGDTISIARFERLVVGAQAEEKAAE